MVGASAGGVEALRALVSGLPADLPAAVFIVLHMPTTATSALPEVLSRYTTLPVSTAVEGAPIELGHLYIAPPDHHLFFQDDTIQLNRGPRENGHRPAVDPLFQSAARAYGPRVIGVILSGVLDDGAMGLSVIKERGGTAIVQDPTDALFPGMPASSLEATQVDAIARADELGQLLGDLSMAEMNREGAVPMPDTSSSTDDIAELEAWEQHDRSNPSVFTCPDCHGTLFEVTEGQVARYRCRVGHGFSAESLLNGQSEALEAALWTALRSLEERNDLLERVARRARDQGNDSAAERLDERAGDCRENATLLRRVLLSTKGP